MSTTNELAPWKDEGNLRLSHGAASPHHEEDEKDRIVELEHVRREHPERYTGLMQATAETVKRKILAVLVQQNGHATYRELEETMTTSRRTIGKRARELRDLGLITIGNGKPAALGFPSEDVALLAEDALSFAYSG